MTHVQHSQATLFLLCPSSTTFPPQNVYHDPCTTFLDHLFLLCLSSTTFPLSKAHPNPCTTFLGHFICFAHIDIPTNIISFLHRKQMMTLVQPSLVQLIPPHASFHCCTFLLTLLSNIPASSKFRDHPYPQILIISSLSQYPRLLSWQLQSSLFNLSQSVNNSKSFLLTVTVSRIILQLNFVVHFLLRMHRTQYF